MTPQEFDDLTARLFHYAEWIEQFDPKFPKYVGSLNHIEITTDGVYGVWGKHTSFIGQDETRVQLNIEEALSENAFQAILDRKTIYEHEQAEKAARIAHEQAHAKTTKAERLAAKAKQKEDKERALCAYLKNKYPEEFTKS